MPAHSQLVLNNSVWIFSLVLQVVLVAALFARGIAQRLPLFATLITFYPIRAALLFSLYGHLAQERYVSLYTALSVLDFLLQTAVAAEIVHHLLQEWGGWSRSRTGLLLLALGVAVLGTVLVLRLTPTQSPVPLDRVQTFLSCLMLLLLAGTIVLSRSTLLRPVTLGLGIYASISLAAQAGRIVAALHRDVAAYTRWSYISAVGYLLVVALWLLTLPQPMKPAPEPHLS